ncbi:CLUMA_CG018662, isoform A [Clunio marinus]|uniref:CLUMA_CG018662, isoform A n=1 Tax=Clunio marinus TaxID=568069 RepID=A0A1J1J3W7_9DIPT|nr:CLUMA_CG018662, isoform A [Clunio marinus]
MIYFIKESKKYDQSSENSSSMELENRNVSSHSHYETSRTVSFNSMPMAYDVIYAQSSSVNPARKAQIPPEDSPPSYDEALRRVKPIKN